MIRQSTKILDGKKIEEVNPQPLGVLVLPGNEQSIDIYGTPQTSLTLLISELAKRKMQVTAFHIWSTKANGVAIKAD